MIFKKTKEKKRYDEKYLLYITFFFTITNKRNPNNDKVYYLCQKIQVILELCKKIKSIEKKTSFETK